ncbi:MAG TPA: tetratricopeptide repeat protein [Bryobacteraceae bacterium]|jgi:TPR repeat protein
MRFSGFVAVLLVFCMVFSAVAQDPAALDALFRQAAEREPRDLAGAARLYEQAARQGHVPSMVRLGYLRQSGEGVPQDQPEAFSLYSQAAKAGDADGKFFQAMSYAQGVGTRKDPVTARNLLLQPATDGHQASQYALGIMLELGEGGPKKEAAARRWLDKASTGPDRELAARAAGLRDKIDKNIFAPDNSGAAFLGLAAFILVAGLLAGDGSDSGIPAGGVSGPAGASGASKAAPRPAHCYPVPVVGVARTGVLYNQGVGTAMRCD